MISNLEKSVLFEPRHLPKSAWLGHIPFANWLINIIKPTLLVELGTERGASYFAFCQSISEAGLSTKAYAVDTWIGDAQSGTYTEEVFREVEQINEKLYVGFSTLMRMTFDECVSTFPDKSIDLLHIDGLHTYEAVSHDFATWFPKISARGVVLFHDTKVDLPGFGVGRFVNELRQKYPVFEFSHSNGLGVVAVGDHVPSEILELCNLSSDIKYTERISGIFTALGDKWQGHVQQREHVHWLEETLSWSKNRADELLFEQKSHASHKVRAEESLKRLQLELAHQNAKFEQLYRERWWFIPVSLRSSVAEAYSNRGWTGVLAAFREWSSSNTANLKEVARRFLPQRRSRPSMRSGGVLIFSGEPDTPGHFFRVERLAEALRRLKVECSVCRSIPELNQALEQESYNFFWIWRAHYTRDLERAVNRAKERGTTIMYDCDDLMFDPKLASEDIIDAIRSGNYNAQEVAEYYEKMRKAMLLADGMTAPTRPLVQAMRRYFRPAFIVHNTFDATAHDSGAQAYIQRQQQASESDIIRIGYASGTLTHQKDFLRAAEGVANCLRSNPSTRLVLFNAPGRPTLDISEFPQFAELKSQIEWRDFVSMDQLPSEMARFDINIAPLENGNPYVEAKSELKYFDAALVRVPTVASPTHPYRTAIQDGFNGLLADTPEDWRKSLSDLVSSKTLRQEMGQKAYLHAIAKYGPMAKTREVKRTMSMMRGSNHEIAINFQSDLVQQARPWGIPACSKADSLFSYSNGRCARATVVMPLYNYQDVVVEALDSVWAQSLPELELIVVDDASTDHSLTIAKKWLEAHRERFVRVVLLKNQNNEGLGLTRNLAVAESSSLYVMPLDADNKLEPKCVDVLLSSLEFSDAALAYPLIQQFGDSQCRMGDREWHPVLFTVGNYIDAMAMVNKCAWSDVGGYDSERTGWEDYEFNCRLIEAGYWGQKVPEAQALYRVHGQSMVRTLTEREDKRNKIAERYRALHPWLDIHDY